MHLTHLEGEMTETERENQSMLANDLRVLVSELNSAIQRAADRGLKVTIQAQEVLDTRTKISKYPEVSIRILAEVQ